MLNSIDISRLNNHLILSVNEGLNQVYPVYSSTFTVKFFPEEMSSTKPQVKFYMHILGIDSAYQSHAGIDVYIREGGTTSLLTVNGVDCTDNLGVFIQEMTSIFS